MSRYKRAQYHYKKKYQMPIGKRVKVKSTQEALDIIERLSKERTITREITSKEKKARAKVVLSDEKVITALYKSFGNISEAARILKMSRHALYENYIKNRPEMKTVIEQCNEAWLDQSEKALDDLIRNREPSAVYFHLKCKGKQRGYIEKTIVGIEDATIGFTKPESDADANSTLDSI
jgi:hypothetical protein